MAIKVVAFDIYGTIHGIDDILRAFPPRNGFYDLSTRCKQEGRIIVTASDAAVEVQRDDLSRIFEHSSDALSLDLFDDFFQLVRTPKEFRIIVDRYGIQPNEFFVFGDDERKDIAGARAIGAHYFHVPQYRIYDTKGRTLGDDGFSFEGFDFSRFD